MNGATDRLGFYVNLFVHADTAELAKSAAIEQLRSDLAAHWSDEVIVEVMGVNGPLPEDIERVGENEFTFVADMVSVNEAKNATFAPPRAGVAETIGHRHPILGATPDEFRIGWRYRVREEFQAPYGGTFPAGEVLQNTDSMHSRYDGMTRYFFATEAGEIMALNIYDHTANEYLAYFEEME